MALLVPTPPLPQHSGARIFDSDGDPIDWGDITRELTLDFAGRQSFSTIFGEKVVGWREDGVSAQFQYNISTRDVKLPTPSGSGAHIHSNARAGATIGTTAGDCIIESLDSLRYRPGHEVTAQFTGVYVGIQAGVKHYQGVLDAVDGFAFGSSGGEFGIWHVANGVETFYPKSEWNVDPLDGSGVARVLDPTAMNLYQIQYGWLGIAPAVFSVYCGTALGWQVVHVLDLSNTQSTASIGNPALPIRWRTVRASGTGTAAAVYTSSIRAGVTAGDREDNSSNRWFSHTELEVPITAAGGERFNIFTIRNNSTFQSKPNHVALELAIVAFDNSGNKTLAFYGTRGGTLTGASAPTAVDASNSVVSILTGGTVAGGSRGPATIVKKDSDLRADVRGTGIVLYPGEDLTLEATSLTAFTGTLSISARWVERF